MPEVCENKRDWLNLPNFLTGLRFVLIPVILRLILSDSWTMQSGGTVLFILAAVTDHLDGRIARRRRQVTSFGNFADPLADKLLTLTVFTAIALRREFSHVFVYMALSVGIIAVREIGITVLRVWTIHRRAPVETSLWGKAKTTAQLITIITTLIFLNFRQIAHFMPEIRPFYPGDQVLVFTVKGLVFICVILAVVSGAIYLLKSRPNLQDTGGIL